jgi:hypothetical protein
MLDKRNIYALSTYNIVNGTNLSIDQHSATGQISMLWRQFRDAQKEALLDVVTEFVMKMRARE